MARDKMSVDFEIDEVGPILDSFKLISELMAKSDFPLKKKLAKAHFGLAKRISEKVIIEKV